MLALSEHPAPLHDSVLLMIDLQNTYRHGVMHLDGVEHLMIGRPHLVRIIGYRGMD